MRTTTKRTIRFWLEQAFGALALLACFAASYVLLAMIAVTMGY